MRTVCGTMARTIIGSSSTANGPTTTATGNAIHPQAVAGMDVIRAFMLLVTRQGGKKFPQKSHPAVPARRHDASPVIPRSGAFPAESTRRQ